MAYEPSYEDKRDFEEATRGFIAALKPGLITTSEGKKVWDIDEYAFVENECPPTANPKLWRQAQLNTKQGLFEVAPGIYQVRALDLSNITIVEGKEGIIIIDPLISCECAAAALGLYQSHRGKGRPITGMIYSHSHGDHYMGARGVVLEDTKVPIIAPEGFLEAIVSESVLAGPAMRRRGAFMYGNALPRGPKGQIGVGLGMGSSTGSTSLIPPNILIQKTGEEHVIDGVRIVFQMVPGTEAPAEINFYFPDFKALCVPETATNCMHNIVTLRGAQVRDAKAWSTYLDEAIMLFCGDCDVVFGSHNWPTWGNKELITRLSEQRDMYGYLHDQTVRMMNLGLTGVEIAERIRMPPAISSAWHCQGYYGSVSHNVKGIYQKYMTWFDGNPAHLWQYPPAEEGQRYVECMGGVDALCDKAEQFIARGDNRFAATFVAHAVAAYPENLRSRTLLATAYENLGFGAENAVWRNFYLTGAQVLRTGKDTGMVAGGKSTLGPQLSVGQWFEILSVQVDGERAACKSFNIEFDVTDVDERWRLIMSNGVLTPRLIRPSVASKGREGSGSRADLSMSLTRLQLLEVLRGKDVDAAKQDGDIAIMRELLDLTSVPTDSVRGPAQL
ncbi:Metallo-hydrolase/oxidoreductase [Cryphonectria parasitica EP155]|uniref:Metallo-hydrolase/oxidoreductase n=1 Tax=Cryphonectria parasitica (strain ATCC 38755 / EP155) TaxID=660469 RepID=A0A9P5CNC9_CRYP1|nr:Metallo-hydrolase/oxidoreductase [Cryphonectria parasitica EP155]KAF3764001.1 Metallo-hydrolase/oxidoreductase [Cryphonectria parasitica EP155]